MVASDTKSDQPATNATPQSLFDVRIYTALHLFGITEIISMVLAPMGAASVPRVDGYNLRIECHEPRTAIGAIDKSSVGRQPGRCSGRGVQTTVLLLDVDISQE
jgi:hypothetical protein